MAGRHSLRSVLAALLLTPALLAGTSGGCDCGSGPGLPETEAVGDCGNSGSSYEEPNPRDLTTSKKKIADRYGYSVRQIRNAIHEVKRKAKLRGRDVLIDVRTGEVYPRTPSGRPGDSVGNIFDFLPEK